MAMRFPVRAPFRLGPGRGRRSSPPTRIQPGGGTPPIGIRQRQPIGREGGRGPIGRPIIGPIRPKGPPTFGGGRPVLTPKPPRPPGLRPPPFGGGPVRFPPPNRNPFGPGGGTDIIGPLHGNRYQRDLRQGITADQYRRLSSGHLPGGERGDFVGLGHDRLQELAGTLHRLPGGQYTSAPIWPGLPNPIGNPIQPIGPEPVRGGPYPHPVGGPVPYQPIRPGAGSIRNLLGRLNQQYTMAHMHPVDQALGPDHGLHPGAVQLLRDQYDNQLLSAAAQQGGIY